MPVANPVIVLLAPVLVTAPGFMVHVPAGKPESTTLPVATAQVGWVVAPGIGDEGVMGCELITTAADGNEIHPPVLVTVKLYVPVNRPDTVALGVFPDIAPGFIVQFPAGNPVNNTLPVEVPQVGCVIVLTTGAEGVPGSLFITVLTDGSEIQPTAFVTV